MCTQPELQHRYKALSPEGKIFFLEEMLCFEQAEKIRLSSQLEKLRAKLAKLKNGNNAALLRYIDELEALVPDPCLPLKGMCFVGFLPTDPEDEKEAAKLAKPFKPGEN